MTVIVAIKGVGMCADTLCSYESGDHYHSQKIYRIDNDIIGLAGDSDECYRWLYWYEHGAKKSSRPELGENFEGLILRGDQMFIVPSSCYVTPLDNYFYGIGCGYPYAMGVLESVRKPTKATMVRAVKTACKLNRWCGIDKAPQLEMV